jgi:Xaa-Pro dipeptidase
MTFERLRELARHANVSAVAVVPGANFYYLTGLHFHLSERPTVLFVPVTGEPVVVVPWLEASKWQSAGIPAQVFAWRDAEGYVSAFQEAAKVLQLQGKPVGVESLQMRVLEAGILTTQLGANVQPADEVFVELRIHKTQAEIEKHRRAIQISEEALRCTLEQIKLGMTENEIARLLSQNQVELGGAKDSFSPIVLIGPRSALPHGVSGNTPLQQGDTLLIDFGTVYENYVSDITRTFFVGDPSLETVAFYEAVLAANQTAIQMIKPGITPEAIDLATAQVLRDCGFGDYILHRTGHGLGIDVHEHPNIVAGNSRPLETSMVFTIEPGLYLADVLGVRIEDNVVVTENGVDCLTTFPRELTVLELA